MSLFLLTFHPLTGPAKTLPVDASQITGNIWLVVCPYCRRHEPSCQVYTQLAPQYRCFNPACHYRTGRIALEALQGIDVLLDVTKATWGEHVGYAKRLPTHTNGSH